VPTYPHDVQKAKDLLASVGLASGVTFTLCHQPDATDTRVAELIQSQLKEAGINAELHPTELTQSVKDYFVDKKFNAGSFGWTGRPDPNMTFRQVFTNTAYFNAGKYEIPGFSALMDQASSVTAIPERQAVYDKVIPLIDDHAINAPLFWYASIDGFTKKLVNYVPNLLAKPKFTEVSLAS
jgi:ABC-type transport system substrate-binding protein